jgi:hypothetical protein
MTVLVVVLGQLDGLPGAASAAQSLLDRASGYLKVFRLLGPGQVLQTLTILSASSSAPAGVPHGANTVVGWPGLQLNASFRDLPLHGLRAGP